MDLATGLAIGALGVAFASLVVSFWSAKSAKDGADAAKVSADAAQEGLTSAKSSAAAGEVSAKAAQEAVKEMARTYEGEKLLSQRQFLIQLWGYMTDVSRIDPKKLVTQDVLKAAHLLELVALCCEGGMVDERIIRRTFAELYRKLYREIEECGPLPGYDPPATGKDVLEANRAARAFMSVLEQEDRDAHKPGHIP